MNVRYTISLEIACSHVCGQISMNIYRNILRSMLLKILHSKLKDHNNHDVIGIFRITKSDFKNGDDV